MNIKSFALVIMLIGVTSTVSGQTFQWAHGAGTWVDDSPNAIVFDKAGNAYVTGHVYSGASFGAYTAPDWGMYLVKFSPAGNVIWAKFGVGSYNGMGQGIAIDSEGSVYAGGSFSHSITFDGTTLAGAHQTKNFLVKYSASGNLQWAKLMGSTTNSSWDNCSGIAVDQDDNVYFTGSFTGTYPLENGVVLQDPYPHYWPDYDAFVAKYTKSGVLAWARTIGSHVIDDYPSGIRIGTDNTLYLMLPTGNNPIAYNNIELTNPNFPISGGSYLLSINPTGSLMHVQSWPGYISSFDVDQTGVLVAGAFDYTIDFGQAGKLTAESMGTFIARYDLQHELTLLKQIPLEFYRASLYVRRFENNIFIVGNVFESLQMDEQFASAPGSMFVAKLNDAGYTQWIKPVLTQGVSSGIDISETGAIAVIGLYSAPTLNADGISLINNSGNGDADIFIGILDDHTPNVCPDREPLLSTDKTLFCEDDEAMLTPAGAGTSLITWLYEGANSGITAPVGRSVDQSGTYYFIVNEGSVCEEVSNAITLRVVSYAPDALAADPGLKNCDGEPVILRAAEDEDFAYKWYLNGHILPTEKSSTCTATESGTYRVEIINEAVCTTDIIQTVTILPTETNMLPDTIYHCFGQELTLSPTLVYNGWNLEWSTGATSASINISEHGRYTLHVFSDGCSASESVLVVEFDNLFIPNVITPNSDGKNDQFVILNNNGTVALSVFDRWGKVVYQDNAYQNNWDASNLQSGVYYYHAIDEKCRNGVMLKGWVHVIR